MDQTCPCPRADGPAPCREGGAHLPTSTPPGPLCGGEPARRPEGEWADSARLTSCPLCSREAPDPHLSLSSAAPRAAAVQAQKAKQAVFLPYLTPISSAL